MFRARVTRGKIIGGVDVFVAFLAEIDAEDI